MKARTVAGSGVEESLLDGLARLLAGMLTCASIVCSCACAFCLFWSLERNIA